MKRIRIRNFMSLRDVTIDFGQLTIIIGPNASGKSAIFRALATLHSLLHGAAVRGPGGDFHLEPAVGLDSLVWQGNSGLPISFDVWADDDPEEEPWYSVELRKFAAGWSVSHERVRLSTGWYDSDKDILEHPTERRGTKRWEPPFRALISHLVYAYRNDQAALPIVAPFLESPERFGEVSRNRPSADDIAAFARTARSDTGDQEKKREPKDYVRENGRGLAVALDDLLGSNRELFQQIEDELRRIFPHIRFINFEHGPLGTRINFQTDRSSEKVKAPQESDGVLLTLFLLWRLFTAEPSHKVCLEEPENGTHPYLLGERYRLIRRFASGETGRHPVQTLVATHSPDFLCAVEKRSDLLDSLRVVEFSPENGTQVNPLRDMKDIDTLLEMFDGDIGEMWWSGAIGAIPRREQ